MNFENERDEQNFSSQDGANWEDVLSDENDIILDLDDQNSGDIQGTKQQEYSEQYGQNQPQTHTSGIQADIIMDDEDEVISQAPSAQTSNQAQQFDDNYDVLAQSSLEPASSAPDLSGGYVSQSSSETLDNDFAYESDDEELARILNSDTPSRQNAFDAFGNGNNAADGNQDENNNVSDNPEDFDIDAQLAEILSEGEIGPDTTAEFKRKKAAPIGEIAVQNKHQSSPIIIVGLIALIIFAGYSALKFIQGNLASHSNPSSVQVGVEDELEENQEQGQEIPVIKEDEISAELSALIGEEKKSTVDVDMAGRTNPFMPSDKYVVIPTVPVVKTKKSSNALDLSGILMPPSEYGEIDETADNLSKIAVSGILYDSINPSAILTFDESDYFVQRGDKLGDYRVVDISKDQVSISYGKNVYKARVGEDFKIFNKFYGSAQFLPKKLGGGRQYELVDKERAEQDDYSDDYSDDSGSSSSYVSSSDVEVKSRPSKEKKMK